MAGPKEPFVKPTNPRFSSGPCTKRPGWSPLVLARALLGRSHRAVDGQKRLKLAIDRTRILLGIPPGFHVGIVPGSDTGAFEMAMWSLLGARGVDVLAWESFGKGWVTDILKQLKLNDVRVLEAPYGALPNLASVDFARDVVFTWNGTTSGVRVPNGDWIKTTRQGLTLIDATSALFAQPIDWSKADVVTFSWQKVLGGEAAHGMLVLSPRAVDRLETYIPPWPLPKLFCMTRDGRFNSEIFQGVTINTPSMLCVEDYLDALDWAARIGGLRRLVERADANAKVLYDWIERTPWVANLAINPATRSNTSVCLKIVAPDFLSLPPKEKVEFINVMTTLLDEKGVAYDIGSYRDAPPGLRIWTGATVDKSDLDALVQWLDFAFEAAKRCYFPTLQQCVASFRE